MEYVIAVVLVAGLGYFVYSRYKASKKNESSSALPSTGTRPTPEEREQNSDGRGNRN